MFDYLALNDELVKLEKSRRCDTRKFFQMIDRVAGNGNRNSRGVRNLSWNGEVANTNAEKAELLKNHLEEQYKERAVDTKDPRTSSESCTT